MIEICEIFRLFNYVAKSQDVLGFSNGTLINVPVFNPADEIIALPVVDLTWSFYLERRACHALNDVEQALWNWCRAAARSLPYNDALLSPAGGA